ncbi:SMI1/KNR4 family protein, partial [Streptomyces sp. NPDC005070]
MTPRPRPRHSATNRRLPYPTFEPVLTPAEIAEVEAQYGVALPEDYRTFLAEVGAGGPGPALELTSLRRIDGRWGECGRTAKTTRGCWTPGGRSSRRRTGSISRWRPFGPPGASPPRVT